MMFRDCAPHNSSRAGVLGLERNVSRRSGILFIPELFLSQPKKIFVSTVGLTPSLVSPAVAWRLPRAARIPTVAWRLPGAACAPAAARSLPRAAYLPAASGASSDSCSPICRLPGPDASVCYHPVMGRTKRLLGPHWLQRRFRVRNARGPTTSTELSARRVYVH